MASLGPNVELGTEGSGEPSLTDIELLVEPLLEEIRKASKAEFGLAVGKFRTTDVDGLPAIRATVVVPSEMFRDEGGEWDRFQLTIASSATVEFTELGGAPSIKRTLISVDGYMRKRRAVLFSGEPSLNMQFKPIGDENVTDERRRLIARAIVRLAKKKIGRRFGTLVPSPASF